MVDSSSRLSQPLRRAGAKGEGSFDPVSWDDAIAEIADRLGSIVGENGGSSVLNAHYTGTFAMIGYHFPLRFFHRLGATEVDPDSVCNKAGHVALEYLYGTSLQGFDPRAARDACSILVWGANPSASAPHQHEHWLSEAPGTVIVVDPLRTDTARRADLHLRPRPGSDAALAFALIHVLWRDGMLDREFIDSHTSGYEELLPAIERCSPGWGEHATGVPASDIEQAAHAYGQGPSLLWIGQGLQRQPTGGNVVRSVGLLPALTGNIGRAGSGFLYLNGIETRGLDGDYLIGRQLAGDDPPIISQMDLARCLEDPARSKALFCWNINIAASSPEQRRLRQALRREDLLTVVVDLFQTDTADYADFVLPASSFLEHDDLVVSYFHHSLRAQVRALDPPGTALSNSDIFRLLSRAMGYTEPELYEPDEEILVRLLEQTGTGLDFGTLARSGTVWPDPEPRLQFTGLEFPTPSGRIEIASDAAERDGQPRVPLPLVDPPPPPGKLRLLSPATAWTLNDSYGNDPIIRERLGAMSVTLNPVDAAARHLSQGDLARVVSETGQLVLPVEVSDDVPPAVALVPKGRWPKLEPSGANVNLLNPGHKSDMGESSSVHGIEVTVEAAPASDTRAGLLAQSVRRGQI
jgi:anaerobic selenocysteine-containing dehydrogenase